MVTIKYDRNYEILQDVLGNAEKRGITDPGFLATVGSIRHNLSDFEPLPRLAHLQLVYEKQPYYGRHLRFYNQAPWWYRLKFEVPEDAPPHAVLRIGAADYYAEVWLNGIRLGAHEGYFKAFEFPCGEAIRRGENLLLIKVSSPWDEERCLGGEEPRCVKVVRHMMKGTYEHADSFGCRDLNPVGLWKPVEVDFYERNRISEIHVTTEPGENGEGIFKADVTFDRGISPVRLRLSEKKTGKCIFTAQSDSGHFDCRIDGIRLWQARERGEPALYTATFELPEDGRVVQRVEKTVGFRRVELIRTAEKTELYLNGQRFFIRGTSYLPSFYLSEISPARLKRDLEEMLALGMNTVRVHVHVQIPEFYELCDEMGLLVIQDSDLNWTFDDSEEFLPHILDVWGQMLTMLGHHPCIAAWGAINEPNEVLADRYLNTLPGPQMEALAQKLCPGIPVIRGSGTMQDLHTGDSHNYTGSLAGAHTHYLDGSYRSAEKLNTEFGVDCPPSPHDMADLPELSRRLAMTEEHWQRLADYQYRLVKYFTEDYRIRKYRNIGGYMQFLFSDPLPQTFYGLYDFRGLPKPVADAVRESNQPIAVILRHDTEAKDLWVINDTTAAVSGSLYVCVTEEEGRVAAERRIPVTVGSDSAVRVCDFSEVPERCLVLLRLLSEKEELLAENHYRNPLLHPAHPEGHPFNLDCEYGMPLYR